MRPFIGCRVTAIDPSTGETNKFDTLMALDKHRKGRNLGVGPWGAGHYFFGQNVVAHNEGEIKVGDVVEVLTFETLDKMVGARPDLGANGVAHSATIPP